MSYSVEVYLNNRKQTLTVEADRKEQVPAAVFEKIGNRATILSITPVKTRKGISIGRKKVSPKDMEITCRQLNALLSSGIPMLDAVKTLKEQVENKKIRTALTEVEKDIRTGLSFAQSLKKHPQVFDSIFCGVIEAAEESGKIEEALDWLAGSFRKEQDLKSKMRQALAYPVIVVIMAAVVTIGLFAFVVPKFIALLTEGGLPIPFFTQVMMFIAQHFLAIAAGLTGLGLAVAGLIRFFCNRSKNFATSLEKKKLKIPFFGKVTIFLNLSRIFWVMGMLLRTGTSPVRTLDILIKSTKFITLQEELETAKLSLKEGNFFSDAFENSCWIRHLENRMIRLGEQSGSLDTMATYAADLLEKEADALLNRLPTIMETSVVVFVGGIVLVVMLSLFLPIASIYQTVM